jgi:hypothetical protein
MNSFGMTWGCGSSPYEQRVYPKVKSAPAQVRDNGIAIDPKFQQRIFGLFERLHSEREYAGTGLRGRGAGILPAYAVPTAKACRMLALEHVGGK